MIAARRSSRPRWVAATVAVCLLALAAKVLAGAAEPRDDGRRVAGRQPTAAASSRPSAGEESAPGRGETTPRRRPQAEAPPQPAAVTLPEARNEFGQLPIGGKTRRGTTNPSSNPAEKAPIRSPGAGLNLTRTAIGLGIVLTLILLLRWIAKRVFGTPAGARSTRAVQVLSRSPVSPRQQLVLLRVGRRLLVVADGGGQMNTLSEITDPDEVAALLGQLQDDHAARMTTTFGNLFGKMRAPFDGEADGAGAIGGAATDRDADGAEVAPARRPALRGRLEEDEDAAVESTRQELSGLMDKVRLLSRQFKSP